MGKMSKKRLKKALKEAGFERVGKISDNSSSRQILEYTRPDFNAKWVTLHSYSATCKARLNGLKVQVEVSSHYAKNNPINSHIDWTLTELRSDPLFGFVVRCSSLEDAAAAFLKEFRMSL